MDPELAEAAHHNKWTPLRVRNQPGLINNIPEFMVIYNSEGFFHMDFSRENNKYSTWLPKEWLTELADNTNDQKILRAREIFQTYNIDTRVRTKTSAAYRDESGRISCPRYERYQIRHHVVARARADNGDGGVTCVTDRHAFWHVRARAWTGRVVERAVKCVKISDTDGIVLRYYWSTGGQLTDLAMEIRVVLCASPTDFIVAGCKDDELMPSHNATSHDAKSACQGAHIYGALSFGSEYDERK